MKLIVRFLKILLISTGLLIIVMVLLFGHRDIPLDELKAKYAPPPSSFLTMDGMDVHYRDEGNSNDSIPLIFIHGTGSSLHTFDAWTAQLITEHRVIRMDLPAYGLTGPFPDREYAIENYVNFLYSFLSNLDIDQCILAGNSLGGGIAWQFTVEYPEMVDKLILIDASGYPNKGKSEPVAFRLARIPVINQAFTYITPRFVAEKSVMNVYADKSKVTDALVDRYFELTLREGNRQAFVDRFKFTLAPGDHEKIRTINQKTLVLWGDQDELISTEIANRFHADLPNDTLVILKNVGHVPMEESPVESLRAVQSFLTKM